MFSFEKKNIYVYEFVILEKTNELVESAKHTAHDVSVKAQELEKSAEASLLQAEQAGKPLVVLTLFFS